MSNIQSTQIRAEIDCIDREIEKVKREMVKKPSKEKHLNDLLRQRLHREGLIGLLLPDGKPFQVVRVSSDGERKAVFGFDSESTAKTAFEMLEKMTTATRGYEYEICENIMISKEKGLW